MTDYWKKYDETERYLHPDQCETKKQLKDKILTEFFGDDERRYGKASEKLASGLWRVKPLKEGVEPLKGVVETITFKRTRKDGTIRTEERSVLRDEKSGEFRKWL